MLSTSRVRSLSVASSPVQCRLLALLLSGLLLIVLDCALLLHGPGHAHDSVRTVSGAQQDTGQVPRAAAPADSSCAPSGADMEVTGRQQGRTQMSAAVTTEASATRAAAPGGSARPASGETRRSTSGRSTLCALCRWRT
ncbi:hypothetical protein OG883_36340 [Streptomyces sp. NBC_01142]|uniref:hypothetical protein n=1 Tax=Streptomyces sp. NBC_01142 TaxID=2975865 RepID=UPI00225919F2|nr:hypothetical protein [Streptomyces sp. NBC_01142]MCX4825236.1 hypothetical protein [Streptomyces sp. NBC_01142]